MSFLAWAIVAAAALAAGGTLYIRMRWRRAPQAYRAMIAVAICFLVVGATLGGGIVRLVSPGPGTPVEPAPVGNGAGRVGGGEMPSMSSGSVIGIADGDTITVADGAGQQEVIRLAGIDAPEHDQAFGAQSTQHLSELVSGKTVTLDCENERSYGRLICKVLLPDGEDACFDQVKAGMAWHYKQYQDEQSPADRDAYAAAECSAMKAKVGLWSDPHPVQPQDFRHGTNSPLLYDGNGCRRSSEPTSGPVVGNSRSRIFEWPACPYYGDISPAERVEFANPQAAEAAGYRPARNCP